VRLWSFRLLCSTSVAGEKIARAFQDAGGDFTRVEAVGVDCEMGGFVIPGFP
jgi:hypothetical protein